MIPDYNGRRGPAYDRHRQSRFAARPLSLWLMIILSLIGSCAAVLANDQPIPLKLDRTTGTYDLRRHLMVYEDKTGEETFDTVRSKAFHSTRQAVPSYGFTRSAQWIKLELENPTQDRLPVILVISNHYLDFVDIFVTSSGQANVERYRGGARVPWNERVSIGNHPGLALSFAPDERKTVFVRVQSGTALWVPLAISSEEAYHSDQLKRYLFLGLFYGVMFFLIVCNLFSWTILKQRSYLYYILTLVGVVVWQLGYDGLSPHVTIFSRPEMVLHLFTSVAWLAFVFNITFVSSFLDCRGTHPVLYRVMDVFLVLAVALALVQVAAYDVGTYLLHLYGIALAWMYVIVIGLIWYRGDRAARYLFFAHLSFPILAVVVFGQLRGFMPYNVFWMQALKIGYLLKGMFLSLALADQYAIIQSRFRHMLEDQVAERSAELLATNDGLQKEILQRKRVEKYIAKAKREWEHTFDTVPDLIAIIDRNYAIQRLNRSMADTLGLQPSDAIGSICYEWCHGTDRPIEACPLRESISDGQEHSDEVHEPRLGKTFLVSVSPLKPGNGGPPELFVHVARDITERKIFEEQLRKLAITDGLTRVWNRRHFMHMAERELDRSKRYGWKLAILLIDLDHFKKINDRYGHDVGDEVLKKVSEVGMNTLRKVDIFARYGGEEFAVALPETNLEQAVQAAERLRQSLSEAPVNTHGEPLFLTVSIGVAMAGPHSIDLSTLLKRADIALYQAKSNGRNRVEVFSQHN